jgi:hypothetical protein
MMPEASCANDVGVGSSVVETRALLATFGDEAGFKAKYGTLRVGLDIVDPHVVDDHAVGGRLTSSHVPLSMRDVY